MSNIKNILPSHLLAMARKGWMPACPVAVDTETSGLHVDSGARISTVSVGWLDPEELGYAWRDHIFGDANNDSDAKLQVQWESGIQTWAIETIDQWTSEGVISFAWPFDQGVEGTGKPEDKGALSLWDQTTNLPRSEYEALLEWIRLVGEAVGLTMQNGKFDLHQFRSGVRIWPDLVDDFMDLLTWDTQNGSDLLWRVFGTSSLKPTGKRLWGEAEGDEQQVISRYLAKMKLPKGRWDLMPWDIIAKYADQDARLTCRIRERHMIDLRGVAGVDGWFDGKDGRMTPQEAMDRRLATTKMLYRVERRGLPFDVSGAHESTKEIMRRVAALEKQLPFKPATLDAAKHYYFGEGTKRGVVGLGRTPYSTTDGGAPQMDKTVVAKMVRDGLPGAEIWRDVQKLNTADSKWYSGWADRAGNDDRLRISFRQNGTDSGRFSAEGLQLHAIPHDYKLSAFQILDGIRSPRTLIGDGVPAGWKLWELDLSQAELRIAALFAECVRMLELIFEGKDIHGDAAASLFGVAPGDPAWGEMRQVAKRFDFSAIFGIGAEKLMNDIEEQTGIKYTFDQTFRLLKDWNRTYPEYKDAIDATSRIVEARMRKNKGIGWITLPNGERRWFGPGEDTHKAFNQRVQPVLAQFGIDWWLHVEQYLVDELGDEPIPGVGRVGMVLMVHDSMVLLLPDDARGVSMVEYAIEYGVSLWRERFPGVPGGIDASAWGDHS